MRVIRETRFLVLAPDAFGTGGIERSTRTLIRALSERSAPGQVGVLSVWGGRVDLPADLPAIVVHKGRRTSGGRRVTLFEKVGFSMSALRAARQWRGGLIIFACHAHLAPVAFAASKIGHAPTVVWCHGDEVWRPQRWTVRASLKRAGLVLAPSEFTANQVSHWAGLRWPPRVLPHAVPPELKPLGSSTVPGRVLAVARLETHDRYKGVDTLLRAWPKVLAMHPASELIVVGDGGDRARLERLAGSWTDNRIRFTGRIHDRELRELYGSSAVFALPTAATVGRDAAGEGFGLVFLEAAAFGLPVVAGRSGAVPEVVEDGRTGLLVDPDDPAAVANAIGTLLRDPSLRTRLGRAARSRVQTRFTFEAFGDGIEAMLHDLLSGSRNDS